MNREQALVYLATVCICTRRHCASVERLAECRACNTFRDDPELSTKTTCVAHTATYKRVRAGAYNGARASWDTEVGLTDEQRVREARTGFDIVAPEGE